MTPGKLSKEQADDLWRALQQAQADRAEKLPTAQHALLASIEAEQRLRELGWRLGGGLKVRRGEECAVAQFGSTGMWRGRVDAAGEYVLFGGDVTTPQKVLLKPLADLTLEEHEHMEACERYEASAMAAMIDRFSEAEDGNTR